MRKTSLGCFGLVLILAFIAPLGCKKSSDNPTTPDQPSQGNPTATWTATQVPSSSAIVTSTLTSTLTSTPTGTTPATSTVTATPTQTAAASTTATPSPALTASPSATLTEIDTYTETSTATATVDQCSDRTQDGAETDVDCGGPSCHKCSGGMKCIADRDCNGVCVGGFCVPFTDTPVQTMTFTVTPTPSSTDTPADTATEPPTDTPTSTDTWTVTSTATASSTDTASATATDTWTSTWTWSETPTSTSTSTKTDTSTATSTATNTPTVTFTPTSTALYSMSFQDGVNSYAGTTDNAINSDSPFGNQGSTKAVEMTGDGKIRFLIRFDLSTASSLKDRLTRAVLTLDFNNVTTAFPAALYQLTSSWVEGTCSSGSWGCTFSGSGSSWNMRDHDTSLYWTTPGSDYNVSAAGPTHALTQGPLHTEDFDIDISTVNGWLTNPTTNDGLILMSADTNSTSITYIYTRDNTTVTTRPMLTLYYN